MAVEAGFDLHELDELTRDLFRTAEQAYPKLAKKFLTKQATEGRKDLRHSIRARTHKVTDNLYKGADRGKVHKYQEDYQVRVYNKAPPAYIVEHGHQNVKTRSGGGRIPVGTPVVMVPGRNGPLFVGRDGAVKRVEGRYPAAEATIQMKGRFPRAVEAFVDELIKEGFEL